MVVVSAFFLRLPLSGQFALPFLVSEVILPRLLALNGLLLSVFSLRFSLHDLQRHSFVRFVIAGVLVGQLLE